MKRITSVLLVLLLAILPFAAASEATPEPYESADGFLYTLSKNGFATITGYVGAQADLVIPQKLDGHPVAAVGPGAFSGNDKLISVTFPGSVKRIEQAFSMCANLKRVVLPDRIAILDDSMFSDCPSLADVTIPDSVTSIGNFVFTDCPALKSIEIPGSVASIGGNPFLGCTGLVEITVAPGNTAFEIRGGALYDNELDILLTYPAGLPAQEYTVPEGTQIIGAGAFFRCAALKAIELPEGVRYVYSSAFGYCESLEHIDLPDSLVYIGESTFEYCMSLAEIEIPVNSLESNPFLGCSALTNLTLSPDNRGLEVAYGVVIGKARKRLICYLPSNPWAEYEVPEGIEIIDSEAFADCDLLVRVTLPEGVTEIRWSAFANCANLESVAIPASVTHIYFDAFTGSEMLVLTVEQGSYAEEYATKYNLPFEYAE